MTPMTPTTPSPTTLRSLRAVIPTRENVTFDEALRIAELQATKLAAAFDASEGITEHHISGLPRIQVTHENLDVSGMSHWNGTDWVIVINKADSYARQRFTLLHEFKHIIDHGHSSRLYTGTKTRTPAQQAETAADYFAGCALVPKRFLKAAWGTGIQRPTDLATHFGVSEHAIRVRLAQTGLSTVIDREPAARCARPVSTPRGQQQRFAVQKPRFAGRFA